MKIKKKIILIVGSGMLGAHLSKYLIKKNYSVVVTTRKLKFLYRNYSMLKILKKVKFIELNVQNKKEIQKVIKLINPFSIYYFAGISSITESFKTPKETILSNYVGAKNFLEILKKEKSSINFFKANSAYIFKPNASGITTKSKLAKPNSPYAYSQIKAFKIIKKYRNLGVNSYNIIFFNIESPIKNNSFLIKKICLAVKKSKINKIKIGNLESVRDYGWAPDIIKGVYLMSKIRPCDLILGTGKGLSTKEILKIIFSFKNLNFMNYIKVDKKFIRKYESKYVVSNMSKSIKILNKWKWKPKIFGKNLIYKMYKNI
jgi:GDPmannose 4,6-dehydratase|tara:strand:- start:1266 stop:2213 length:948 start_codon:yes stop_codon:yes gene_type:complete